MGKFFCFLAGQNFQDLAYIIPQYDLNVECLSSYAIDVHRITALYDISHVKPSLDEPVKTIPKEDEWQYAPAR